VRRLAGELVLLVVRLVHAHDPHRVAVADCQYLPRMFSKYHELRPVMRTTFDLALAGHTGSCATISGSRCSFDVHARI
jgi:hypothetical protein